MELFTKPSGQVVVVDQISIVCHPKPERKPGYHRLKINAIISAGGGIAGMGNGHVAVQFVQRILRKDSRNESQVLA